MPSRPAPRLLPWAFAALAILAAPAGAQQLVPAKSEIAFTSKQMGVPVNGTFRRFAAQVAFDPKKPEAASIALTVDTASATLGSAETDAEVVKPDWFSAKAFPQATFRSRTVKTTSPGHYDVAGTLTIKGTSRDLVVPVVLTQAAGATTATGQFAIKRLDWRIGDGDWKDTSMVADEVQVRFRLALTGVAPM